MIAVGFFKVSFSGSFKEKTDLINSYSSLANFDTYLPEKDEIWDENYLDYRPILSMAHAIFGINQLQPFSDKFPFDYSVAKSCCGAFKLPKLSSRQNRFEIGEFETDGISILQHTKETSIPYNSRINTGLLKYYFFPDFRMLICRSPNFYLIIQVGPDSRTIHSLGHTHNDLLSIELQINGRDVISDPGTFVYTPSREWRNKLRSTYSHNTISVNDIEQNRWFEGKFWNFNKLREAKGQILLRKDGLIVLSAEYRGINHLRKIDIQSDQLIITDYCNSEFAQNFNFDNIRTSGYGKLQHGTA